MPTLLGSSQSGSLPVTDYIGAGSTARSFNAGNRDFHNIVNLAKPGFIIIDELEVVVREKYNSSQASFTIEIVSGDTVVYRYNASNGSEHIAAFAKSPVSASTDMDVTMGEPIVARDRFTVRAKRNDYTNDAGLITVKFRIRGVEA